MKTSVSSDRIAFIGLGMMGYPLAGRLAEAGYQLSVFDLNRDYLAAFTGEFPCRTGATALEAVQDADVVITMVPNSDNVFDVVLGSDSLPGIASVLKPGTVVIDMSSCDPLRTRELANILAESGITLVDAPVSGGVKKAREGKIAIMFGGSNESLQGCRSILETMGSTVIHTGAVGTGHAMKALNNYVSAAGLAAVVEALHTGEKFGLDPKVMVETLNVSTGRNNTTENKAAQFMLSGTFSSGFSLQLMAKDVGIALHLAEQLEVAAPLGQACVKIWSEAAVSSDKTTDHTELYRIKSR